MLKISREEKKIQFIYLIAFWLMMSVLFCYVCFYNYPKPEIRSKEIVIAKINEQNKLLKKQLESAVHVDSLSAKIMQYQPATSQVYLESSINAELEDLKTIYEAKKEDGNYKVFNQLYIFYSMQLFDKKAISNSTNNAADFKKSLDDCTIGFRQNQETLMRNTLLNRQ